MCDTVLVTSQRGRRLAYWRADKPERKRK